MVSTQVFGTCSLRSSRDRATKLAFLAQLVEHQFCTLRVVGSSPIEGSMEIERIIINFDEDWQNPYNFRKPREYDPCEWCMNNPKNNPNASGICSCALPDLCRKIY